MICPITKKNENIRIFLIKNPLVLKIKKIAVYLFSSSLFQLTSFFLFSTFYPLKLSYKLLIFSLFAICFILRKKEELLYEISILDTFLRFYINPKKYPWYNKIYENIYHGAMPMKNLGHEKFLKENISSVLSLVEPYEVEKKTLISDPIDFSFFKKNKINHLNINIKDMNAMNLKDMNLAADFIYKNSKIKKIYVNCKAGRSRSSLAILAYLIKYKKMKVHEAVNFLYKKREVVFLTLMQKRSVNNFYKDLSNLNNEDKNYSFLPFLQKRGIFYRLSS